MRHGGPSKAVPHQMGISSQAPKGLTFQTIDGGYSDLLLKKLEENYMNSRRLVFVNNKHILMTPIKFLRYLCTNMETGIHVEKFRFCLGPEIGVQHRTEIFAGRFCGVAHSEHNVLSVELAAANVLERMWNYFKIQGFDSSYAVFPVRIDDKIWGGKLAAAEMYKHLTDPMKGNLPPLVDVQLQDYFAVGAECPTLTQIFAERGLITNSPEGNKREWMLENNVTDADIDSCLHDPSNSSSYLDNNGIWVSANAKLEFKTRLEEAAKRASAGGLTYPESNHLV
ncbi:hypothetical protein Ocin01_19290 [Orchesella cincta]|uniref:Uncharacterized protein n=1 Tax=Orchesella cincta TaxID=48709 RepID=A0A1D2M379_ORCCI|nr:hypothetical protein Ocin01_19290 [Orchesella cincta]